MDHPEYGPPAYSYYRAISPSVKRIFIVGDPIVYIKVLEPVLIPVLAPRVRLSGPHAHDCSVRQER